MAIITETPTNKIPMKRCGKCGQEKPASFAYYHAKKDTRDGFCLYCKECISQKSQMDYQKRRKQRSAYNRAYYQENCERLCEQKRQFRKDNKEHVKALEDGYRKAHKDAIVRRKKAYYYANKDRILTYLENYRNDPTHKAKAQIYNRIYCRVNRERLRGLELFKNKRLQSIKAGLPATFNATEWQQCKNHFNNTCTYCGKSDVKLEQEHFIPISSGGGYEKTNIVPSCSSCNRSKGNKAFAEWYKLQPFYSEAREQKLLEYLGLIRKEREHEPNQESRNRELSIT